MRGWGITLMILGAGSFILPMFGMQFKLVAIFGDGAPIAAVVMIAVGALLTLLGGRAEA